MRGWILLDAVSWILVAILCGMALFGEWPESPYDVILLAALLLACLFLGTVGLEERSSKQAPT